MQDPQHTPGVYIPSPVEIGVPAGTPASAGGRTPRPTETKQAGDFTVHEAAAIFPPMSDAEFTALVADMRQKGQLEPLWTYNGTVIDGRHRLKACAQLGMLPYTREWDGVGSLTDFIVSVNLHRRHLKENQRAMIAARTLPFYEAEALVRKQKRGVVENEHREMVPYVGRSADQAGGGMRVSGKSVTHARHVLKHGTPELIAQVDLGKVPVFVAAKIAKHPPEEQARLLALTRGERAKALKPAPATPAPQQPEMALPTWPGNAAKLSRTASGFRLELSRDGCADELRAAASNSEFLALLECGVFVVKSA